MFCYVVEYIGPGPLCPFKVEPNCRHLDLSRAPYVVYGVKYIDLVSLAPFPGQLLVSINGDALIEPFWYFGPCPYVSYWLNI